jgi:membrane protein DedA with SNARE-associated domain
MISSEEFWQYFGIFISLVVSAVGAPIPEEIPIATAGVLVGRESANPDTAIVWWAMLPMCIIGVVMCDTLLYVIGRKYGGWLIKREFVKKYFLPTEKYEKIKKNFDEYGILLLMFARLIPGVRTGVFMTAGMIKLSFRKFLFADALYALPGVNILFWLGYWYADTFLNVLNRIEGFRQNLVILVILTAVIAVIAYLLLRRRTSTGDPKEIPIVGKQVAQIGHTIHDWGKTPDNKPRGEAAATMVATVEGLAAQTKSDSDATAAATEPPAKPDLQGS